MLIKGREKVGIKKLKNPKAFTDYSQAIDDDYENLDYNPTKIRKVLIVFDDMIVNMEPNKKLNPIVTEFFLRERQLNISLVFISQSYFKARINVRINATHHFIMRIPNKGEIQQIMLNHSSDIDFKNFLKFYKEP